MINYIDLVKFAHMDWQGKGGNGTLKNIRVMGYINKPLSTPPNLGRDVQVQTNGFFANLSCFCVDLSYYERELEQQLGLKSEKNLYMVNGELITYVQKDAKYPDWYTLEGTLVFSRIDKYYCSLFKWVRNGKSWAIAKTPLNNLSFKGISNEHDLCEYLRRSAAVGRLDLPTYVTALPRFTSTMKELQIDLTNNGQSKGIQQTSNTVNSSQFKGMQQTAKPAKALTRTNRQKVQKNTVNIEKVRGLLENSKSVRQNHLKSILDDYRPTDSVNSRVSTLFDRLIKYKSSKPDTYARTGNTLLKKYLADFSSVGRKPYLGSTVEQFVLQYITQVRDLVCGNCYIDDTVFSDVTESYVNDAFSDTEMFYAKMLGITLGIQTSVIEDLKGYCDFYNISIVRVLTENPYIICLFGLLNYSKVEQIAVAVGVADKQDLAELRNIGILDSEFMFDGTNNTIYDMNSILKTPFGLSLTKAEYKRVSETGTFLKSGTIAELKTYFDCKVVTTYSPASFKSIGNKYVRRLSYNDITQAVEKYKGSGMGISFDNGIVPYQLAEQELYVFDCAESLAEKETGITPSDIEPLIAEFENLKGFTLEPEQRDAAMLLTHGFGLVAGCAGSGKTTDTELFVYILERLSNKHLYFSAPTGKAAKRMQEVIKRRVYTLHRLCRIGVDTCTSFGNMSDDDISGTISDSVLLIDEGAMVSLSLLTSVLKRVDLDSCYIYMFGDPQQLSPIGKSLPFRNYLRTMPTQYLNVSKRASSGSNITLASNYVTDNSDADSMLPLPSEKDFFLVPCSDEDISYIVSLLCKYYLGKATVRDIAILQSKIPELPSLNITKDDIQVITPYKTPRYSWSSTSLNRVLQPIFNDNRDYRKTVICNNTRFVIGDRVIHTNKNMYNMQWYEDLQSDGTINKKYGYGIANGDVGVFVGIISADNIYIQDEVELKPDDFDEYPDSLRDDMTWVGNNKYFMVVKYYDYLSQTYFNILYRCSLFTGSSQDTSGINIIGEDIQNLELFYAGTVHKLQGSEVKLGICTVGNTYGTFVNNNMIYTMMTRGKSCIFMVGDVSNNHNSSLSKARLIKATTNTKTLGEKF